MEREKEDKELELLAKANLKPYTIDNFKKYWTEESKYISKKKGVKKAIFITVYSVWHKRLLARVFYFEEYMYQRRLHRLFYEVQRQLGGLNRKLVQRTYSAYFYGYRVWTGNYHGGWKTVKSTTHQLGYNVSIGFYQHNDPMKYLKKSTQKYCAYEYFPENVKEHDHLFEYLTKYEKHPQMEMLLKLGLSHLIDDLRGIRWTKKGPAMLGITKEELPYLKTGMALRDYRRIRDMCLKYKFDAGEARTLLLMVKSDMHINPRTVKYITKNKISLFDYQDLINAKNKLGLPDENKYLYPEDFMKMHDDLNDRLVIVKSKEITEMIMKRKKELCKYMTENEGIVIKPLLEQKEFINEGKALSHCVGGYAERVAKGQTAIYTIRLKEKPEEPLATLQLTGKKVIQVRGFKNSNPPENIVNFVKQWEKKFKLHGY